MSMQISATPAAMIGPHPVDRNSSVRRRSTLVILTILALLAASLSASVAPSADLDADLARILRFMAALKLMFALFAGLASWWRLARTTNPWRNAAYIVGPPLAIGGSILMVSLQHLGLAAIALHTGLLAILAAALTDTDFLVIGRASSLGRNRAAG